MEPFSSVLSLLMALTLAMLVFKMGRDLEITKNKPFESIEFAGKHYVGVDLEEKHLGARVIELLKQIKDQQEGVILEKNEPIIALLPMEEFLRLKGLEEYLDDCAIATLIEERLANRDKTQTHPLRDFEAFRQTMYQEEKKEKEEESTEKVQKKEAEEWQEDTPSSHKGSNDAT